jgi:hypothetical protein
MKKTSNPEFACRRCNKSKKIDSMNFFKSYSDLDATGFTSICKECSYELFNEYMKNGMSHKDATKEMCKALDKPFIEDVYKSTVETTGETDKFLGVYSKNVHMQQWIKRGIKTFSQSIFSDKQNIYSNVLKPESELSYSAEWRGNYNQADLEYLEEYYRDLHNDFKIITKNHKDYARKIAKASLAMDKAYEDMLNSVSGADKRYKDLKDTFDQLSKSAQFSENTRGANDVSLGCFGVIFERVEKKQWIPKHTPLEKDTIDKLIDYFGSINKSL